MTFDRSLRVLEAVIVDEDDRPREKEQVKEEHAQNVRILLGIRLVWTLNEQSRGCVEGTSVFSDSSTSQHLQNQTLS